MRSIFKLQLPSAPLQRQEIIPRAKARTCDPEGGAVPTAPTPGKAIGERLLYDLFHKVSTDAKTSGFLAKTTLKNERVELVYLAGRHWCVHNTTLAGRAQTSFTSPDQASTHRSQPQSAEACGLVSLEDIKFPSRPIFRIPPDPGGYLAAEGGIELGSSGNLVYWQLTVHCRGLSESTMAPGQDSPPGRSDVLRFPTLLWTIRKSIDSAARTL
eukprot:1196407-Prorocentrum_minimum.AAC.1